VRLLKSIKTKLIFLTLGIFIAFNLSTALIVRFKLKDLVDVTQRTIYNEKLALIIKELEYSNEKLNHTGLREVYIQDFQDRFINRITQNYYSQNELTAFPFIIHKDLSVIVYPNHSRENLYLNIRADFSQLKHNQSEFYGVNTEGEFWYIGKIFEPWDWIVIYEVPLNLKYSEMYAFFHILLIILSVLSCIYIPLIIYLATNITAPIIKLTDATTHITQGDLNQIIPESGNDEVSILARSISTMQHSIKQTIEDLNLEMKEKSLMEEQLIQARKMDAIGQLAGGVAHDFNNMLGGIYSAAQLLAQDKEVQGENRDYINMILETTERAADLTSNLLAFGRKKKITTSLIDIHKVIQDALSLLKRTLDKKIIISHKEEAKESHIIGNIMAIQNSIMNLAINAAHAMPDGGHLILTTQNTHLNKEYCHYSPFDIIPGLYLEFSIKDTGTGISPEIKDKIFEPFFTSKGLGQGPGLGLSMVYGTIQEHKGAISLITKMGKGSEFHLYFPLP
jgi:signal transduction histidine kinase